MADPISSVAASPAFVAESTPQSRLAENFDTFLILLTTQLKNQDPLAPMDSSEFTQQLVQFSQVEQQINANKNLETLIALTQARTGMDAVSYLGKTVTLTDGSAALQDGGAEWSYTLNGEAATTVLTVTNAAGRLVYAASGETANGEHVFHWDGRDAAGMTAPEGAYVLNIQALLADWSRLPVSVRSQGVVEEIDLSQGEPILMIGPMGVPLSRAFLIAGT